MQTRLEKKLFVLLSERQLTFLQVGLPARFQAIRQSRSQVMPIVT